jgi:TonB-linked SusC/RagA family outer membrane protein
MNRTSTIRSGGFVSRDKQKIIWLLHRSAAVLLFLLLSIFSSAQTTTQVTGKVLDEKGQPIPGASIRVKGTTVATVSSASGNFTIVAAPTTTLTVTYVGYTTKDSPVNNQKTLTVSLTPSSSALNEVVVVGYGTQKKVNLTGAVSSVTSQEIVTTKNENVQNMLTGKVAGLTVVQNSSEPGAFDNTFDIRGMGSPLVIIDGIPRENITRLDPNDIESISVLKDASAAVYGVRAANGVVLVTTKRGKKGSLELNYSGTQTWQVPVGLPKSVDAIGYMTLVNEKLLHNVNGGTAGYTTADFDAYRNGSKVSTDWYSPVIKDVIPQFQHNLSASGGNENTNYYLSLGYTGQEGFLKSDDLNYKRYNVRSNISSRVTKNLTVDLNINAIMDEKNQPYTDATNIIRSFWRQNPLEGIYANNNPAYLFNPSVDGTNPVSLADKDVVGYKKFTNRWLQSSISLTYNVPFIKGLQAKGLYSYDYNTADNKLYQKQYNQYTYDAASDAYKAVSQQSPSTLRREYYSRPNTLSQLSLNYDHTFGQSHNISALLLLENSNRQSDNFFAQRELSLPVDQLLAGNSLNQIGSMNANDLYENANSGLVGRINYNYKGKYLAEFSFRDDVSSKFPVYNQQGFFPSISAGWRISEEGFWKNSSALSFISNLKLRANYGKLGDDGASSYQYITGYTYPAGGDNNRLPPGSVFNGTFVNSLASKGLANPDIFWYVAKTLDIGVDIEAWKGLLGITADVFRRDRTGLLATRNLSLPSVVGATLPQENLNSDRSQGLDLEINHRNHIGDFNYFVKAIFSYSRTQNRYVEQARAGNSFENWRNNSNNRANDARWGYGTAGQYQSYNDIINSPTFVGRNTVVGDYAYEDWNVDGIISDLDVHPIAFNGIPKINYGLTIGGSYKGIDVNLLFQGTGIVDVSYIEQLREPLWGGGSGLDQFLDRWHTLEPGADPYDPNTQWVAGHYATTGSLPDENSRYNLQNASYLRLKSVELGYNLSSRLTSKMGIKGARIYVNGYNIFTLTDVKYVDPEHPSGSYGYLYPLNKTYSVGLNVKF